jgi:hypothetical protein
MACVQLKRRNKTRESPRHAAHAQLAVLPDTDHTYAYRDAADAYEILALPFLGKLSGRAA